MFIYLRSKYIYILIIMNINEKKNIIIEHKFKVFNHHTKTDYILLKNDLIIIILKYYLYHRNTG